MRAKQIASNDGSKTFVLIFDVDDEVVSVLLEYVKANNIGGAHFTAIGACSDVTLGFFDWKTKEYQPIRVPEQVEVLSLIGDVALDPNGDPKVHGHMAVARSDGSTAGGHLLEAHVRPTLELILIESPVHLWRSYVPEVGLALIRF